MTVTLYLWIAFWVNVLNGICIAFLLGTNSYPVTVTKKAGRAVVMLIANIVWAYLSYNLIP